MVQMELERDRTIETDISGLYRVGVKHAQGEGDESALLVPQKEAHSFWHGAPNSAKVLLGQLLEMEVRSLVHLQVERVDRVNARRNVSADTQCDGRRLCRSTELPSQLSARCAVERPPHILVEALIIDVDPCHRQTRNSS